MGKWFETRFPGRVNYFTPQRDMQIDLINIIADVEKVREIIIKIVES